MHSVSLNYDYDSIQKVKWQIKDKNLRGGGTQYTLATPLFEKLCPFDILSAVLL